MATKISLKFKWQDIIIIVFSLIFAVAVFLCFIPKEADTLTVEIKQSGKLIYSLPLNKDTAITIDGEYQNTIEIKNNTVCFSYSTCPNHDCESIGLLTKVGDIAVCLPNRVSVEIKGGNSNIDGIAG